MLSYSEKNINDSIIIVSGLPRSGTSMMMKMLSAGGLDLLMDDKRNADVFNPNGYYEYEAVKSLKDGNTKWLEEARGRVVKVVSPLLHYLPSQYPYQIIFMKRNLAEVISSQTAMLNGFNKTSTRDEDIALEKAFQLHLTNLEAWIEEQPNMRVMYVDYQHLIFDTEQVLSPLLSFIARPFIVEEIFKVIDVNLYHNRNGGVLTR